MVAGDDDTATEVPVETSDVKRRPSKSMVTYENKDSIDGDNVKQQSEEEGEEKESNLFPSECPEGVLPMMISIKNMDKYELKTGPGLKDTLLFKWFGKENILEEIQSLGFYSDFNDFKKEISAFPGDKVLILTDHEEVYGQNWMICVTPEATTLMEGLVNEALKRAAAEQRRIEENNAARLAAEEAERNVVHEDKPMVPQPRAEGNGESEAEIAWLDMRPVRKLMVLSITRRRADFGAPIKLNDRDAEQNGLFEFRQHKDPNYELKRRQLDTGLQACPSWTTEWIPHSAWARSNAADGNKENKSNNNTEDDEKDFLFFSLGASAGTGGKRNQSSVFDFCANNVSEEDIMAMREVPQLRSCATQTSFFRLLNSSTQYQHIELSEAERETATEDNTIAKFLGAVMPAVEFALQQNETLDVFSNEFLALRSEEVSGLANKEDNYLRELRTFTDLVYSNGKLLSAVDWHPHIPNVVAVSCVEPLQFDQLVDESGKERNSFILIWNFADLIHPQLVLQSPYECTQFSFNPDEPHLIAGGCVTGQIILWNISKALSQLRRKNGAKAAAQAAEAEDGDEAKVNGATNVADAAADVAIDGDDAQMGVEDDEGEESGATIAPVEPTVISLIDQSHKRPVSHLEWIPSNLNVNSQGKVKVCGSGSPAVEKKCHQLVTCAGDGKIIFWDTRLNSFKRVKANVLPEDGDDDGNNASAAEELQWVPTFKCSLTRDEGTRDYSLSKFALRGRLDVMLDSILGGGFDTNDGRSKINALNASSSENVRKLGNMAVTGTGFSCTTEDGDIIFGDWQGTTKELPKSNRSEDEGSSGNVQAPKDDDATTDEKIQWVATDHFRNSIVLTRSPFLPYLLLSVSSNGFNIWKEDLDRPLFSSPIAMGMAHLTCASWSPTRPAVIIVGKSDGTVDIWDLTDQSHHPSATVPIGAYGITSMQFRADDKRVQTPSNANVGRASKLIAKHLHALGSSGAGVTSKEDERALREILVDQAAQRASQGDKAQLLALGDATGNLHVLEIPRNLRWRMPNEEKLICNFFERELERVAYVSERAVIRNKERENLAFDAVNLANATTASDDREPNKDSKAYKKLVEAEEKRYLALSAKLLANLS